MLPATFRHLTWAFALALAVAACDAGGAEERVMACSLLRRGEVARILGGRVREPDATADEGADALAGRSGCAWARVDGKAAVLVELLRTDDMSDVVRRTGFSAAARYDAARSRHPDAEHLTVSGADAMWVAEAATLHVLTGASYLTFEVAVANPPRARPTATALATSAVRQLPERAD